MRPCRQPCIRVEGSLLTHLSFFPGQSQSRLPNIYESSFKLEKAEKAENVADQMNKVPRPASIDGQMRTGLSYYSLSNNSPKFLHFVFLYSSSFIFVIDVIQNCLD